MLEYREFKDIVHKVEKACGRADEETRKIYYDAMKGYDSDTIRGVADHLIKTHGFYKFPTLAEFIDATKEVAAIARAQETPSPRDFRCEACGGTGRYGETITTEGYQHYKERFCLCDTGRTAWQNRVLWIEANKRKEECRTKDEGSASTKSQGRKLDVLKLSKTLKGTFGS